MTFDDKRKNYLDNLVKKKGLHIYPMFSNFLTCNSHLKKSVTLSKMQDKNVHILYNK